MESIGMGRLYVNKKSAPRHGQRLSGQRGIKCVKWGRGKSELGIYFSLVPRNLKYSSRGIPAVLRLFLIIDTGTSV